MGSGATGRMAQRPHGVSTIVNRRVAQLAFVTVKRAAADLPFRTFQLSSAIAVMPDIVDDHPEIGFVNLSGATQDSVRIHLELAYGQYDFRVCWNCRRPSRFWSWSSGTCIWCVLAEDRVYLTVLLTAEAVRSGIRDVLDPVIDLTADSENSEGVRSEASDETTTATSGVSE